MKFCTQAPVTAHNYAAESLNYINLECIRRRIFHGMQRFVYRFNPMSYKGVISEKLRENPQFAQNQTNARQCSKVRRVWVRLVTKRPNGRILAMQSTKRVLIYPIPVDNYA